MSTFSRSHTHSAAADWENPAVYGINKRNAHVTLRSFTHPHQAFDHYRLLSETSSSPRRISLNGTNWDFYLARCPSEVPEDFWMPEYDCSQWDKVRKNIFFYLKANAAPFFPRFFSSSKSKSILL